MYFPLDKVGLEENSVLEDYLNTEKKIRLKHEFTSLTLDRFGALKAVKLNPLQEKDGIK